nr:HNH endonuclease signature motif containing protein [Bosea sp. Leaf344]
MSRPARICACGNRVPRGIPCRCQREATRLRVARHDRRRPQARERGYDHEWRKARIEYLATRPNCAMPGCDATATTVDHIIPHRGDRALFWNCANWQPLCTHCHNSAKQRLERSPSR